MERDEQIIKASTDTFKEYGDEFAKVVRLFWISAFIAGGDWADKHPKNVWHQADEEPVGRDWRILCQNVKGECWIKDGTDAMKPHNTWDEYAAVKMIVKWAYLDELIK